MWSLFIRPVFTLYHKLSGSIYFHVQNPYIYICFLFCILFPIVNLTSLIAFLYYNFIVFFTMCNDSASLLWDGEGHFKRLASHVSRFPHCSMKRTYLKIIMPFPLHKRPQSPGSCELPKMRFHFHTI